jgi:hypothetical protein
VEKKHGHDPDLGKHRDPGSTKPFIFGWSTKDELLKSAAFVDFVLIEPDKIGNGRGKETNLYVALTTGVDEFPRMPRGGPFLSASDTDAIAAWIDAGVPD